ncbi:hypothetical protein V1511DRAFT_347359 [Dipodascopsis uninucleata]
MPDDEKSRLYLYSVPPPYEVTDEEDEENVPSSSSSGRLESSTPAERQQFIPRGLRRHEESSRSAPVGGDDDSASISLSTPRSSDESDGLRREIYQLDIIEPPMSSFARPSISSRIATTIKSQVRSINNFTNRISNRLASKFKWIPARYRIVIAFVDSRLEKVGNPLLIKRLVVVFMLSLVLWVVVETGLVNLSPGPSGAPWPPQHYELDGLRRYYMLEVDSQAIEKQMENLSKLPHMAGTRADFAFAEYITNEFKSMEAFDDVEITRYNVLLTYAESGHQRLYLIGKNSYEAALNEPPVYSGSDKQPYPLVGLSASGNVTGHLIYANYGTKKDFELLKKLKVKIDGAIVICRYGLLHESLKIKAAELYGAKGVVLFRDKNPSEDSFPNGRSIPEDGVQRGSAALRNWIPGDVLTPEWPSTPTARKDTIENSTALTHIPSIPISWSDAKHFINAIKGHGRKVDASWVGNFAGVAEWWTGSSTSPLANLESNLVEEERQPIWNVIAKLEGMEQSEKAIILGAHRDSWCYGSSDAVSGTAVMLEVARVLGSIVRTQYWRPSRSIYFASWDGTEQNLIGSTEWVEANIDALRAHGEVYINLDQAVSGPSFRAKSNPLLQNVLYEAMRHVHDISYNGSMLDAWGEKSLPGLEGDVDTLPFQSYAGVASIDLGFESPGGYPTRTCYDNIQWMKEFGDPTTAVNRYTDKDSDSTTLVYHKMLAQLVGAMIIRLADEYIIPFDVRAYGDRTREYLSDLQEYAGSVKLDTSRIDQAIDAIISSAAELETWAHDWEMNVIHLGDRETAAMAAHRFSRNSRVVNFDKHLLNDEGIPGRTWLKHVLFAPQMWPPTSQDKSFKSSGTFPSVRDALERGDKTEAQIQLDKVASYILQAAEKLTS